MYPEFIAIYAGLAILIGLGIVILILLIKLVKNNDGFPMPSQKNMPVVDSPAKYSESSGGNMAFCKKCAAQFDSSQRCCPKCGTPR